MMTPPQIPDWSILAGSYLVLSGIFFEAWWNTKKRSAMDCWGLLLLWLVLTVAVVGTFVLVMHFINES